MQQFPASVTNLVNVSYAPDYINWTWTDPQDIDFSRFKVYLNGVFKADIFKGKQYYNASGLAQGTVYSIGKRTVDTFGNINTTWVNSTSRTLPSGVVPPVSVCGADKFKCENVISPAQFNASATYDPDGAIVLYYWDFGDGMNGTGAAPKHTYASYKWNGRAYRPFIVNLTVMDNDGMTNSTSMKVVIWIPGDTNGDGKVNILDTSIIGLKWGISDPCADMNNDGKVNTMDASIIGLNWGKISIIK